MHGVHSITRWRMLLVRPAAGLSLSTFITRGGGVRLAIRSIIAARDICKPYSVTRLAHCVKRWESPMLPMKAPCSPRLNKLYLLKEFLFIDICRHRLSDYICVWKYFLICEYR